MRKEDTEELNKLIGAKVVEVRVSNSEDDYGFELVFDNGLCLEIDILYEDNRASVCGWTIMEEDERGDIDGSL